MSFGDKWDSKKFPDGCRSCGQTQYRHIGNGLCGKCYRQWAKNGDDIESWLDGERDVILTAPAVEEHEPDEEAATPDPVESSRRGEVRPGSSGSPLTNQTPAPPDVEEKKSIFSRRKKSGPPRELPTTREKRPKPTGRRVSAADTLTDLYGALGGLMQRVGASPDRPVGPHAPLGRFLAWQAPIAGELLDQTVANTFVDNKLLQPAVRARSSFDTLAALLGPPAIIFAIESHPERAEALIPLLENSIRSSLPTLLPAMKKMKEREEKVRKATAEMFPDLPPGVDPVHQVIEEMFAGFLWASAPKGEGADSGEHVTP